MDSLSLEAPSVEAPPIVDLDERRQTFTWFAKAMLLFAAHVLVILAILGLVFVW
jgi:hypothetical protein